MLSYNRKLSVVVRFYLGVSFDLRELSRSVFAMSESDAGELAPLC